MKSFLKQINESFQALDEKAKSTEKYDDNPKLKGDQDELPDALQKAIIKKEAVDQDKDGDNDFDDVKIARMMASGMSKEDALKKVREEKELEEMSTTAGVAPVTTPYAFSKKEKKKMKYPGVAEAMDRKYEQLIEGYKQFALGEKNSSPAKTVNSAIREVAKQLKSIEETVKYTSRLKTESGISHSGFSSGTHNALRKISERLVKISERVRSLGE